MPLKVIGCSMTTVFIFIIEGMFVWAFSADTHKHTHTLIDMRHFPPSFSENVLLLAHLILSQ